MAIRDGNLLKLHAAIHGMQRRTAVGGWVFTLIVPTILIPLALNNLRDGGGWDFYLVGIGGLVVGGMFVFAAIRDLFNYVKHGRKPESVFSQPRPATAFVDAVRNSRLVDRILAGEVTGQEVGQVITTTNAIIILNDAGDEISVDWGRIAENCMWYLTRRGISKSSLELIAICIIVVCFVGCWRIVDAEIVPTWLTVPVTLAPYLLFIVYQRLLYAANQYTQAFYAVVDEKAAQLATGIRE